MGIDRTLFVNEIPVDCLCSICQDVLQDPKEALTCQHAFCEPCILVWLQDHTSCPLCRCSLSVDDLVTLHRVWRKKLNNLQMKCFNNHSGCKEVVRLEQMGEHLDECGYAKVTCPHSPCSALTLRSSLPKHILTCDYRVVACQICKLSVPAKSLKDHECVSALREDMQRKMEILKREWTDAVQNMYREHEKLEGKIHSQANEIDELRKTIASTILQQKSEITFPGQLPSVRFRVIEGTPRRCHYGGRVVEGAAAMDSGSQNYSNNRSVPQESQRRTRNSSLPRLAPLHTRMTLNRNSNH